MQFTEGSFYHIYNRGNDKRIIFFEERNYDFFLQKVKKYIASYSNLLAWSLMPNHFHFLIQANASTVTIVKEAPIKINALTEGIRMLLSSYTKAIQKQESITGNLFQQKTKFKCVDCYLPTAFHYIHQNAFRAKLVHHMEDWKWSSLQEYLELPSEMICKKEVAYSYIDINKNRLLEDSYSVIPEEFISKLL
jgi:putative transposase